MYRPAAALLLLLPCWYSHAGCEVATDGGDTVTLVVKSGGCFRSPEQKQAFAAQLKEAVGAMNRESGGGFHRKSTAEQLNGFGDLKRQARNLSPAPPVYYGQR